MGFKFLAAVGDRSDMGLASPVANEFSTVKYSCEGPGAKLTCINVAR